MLLLSLNHRLGHCVWLYRVADELDQLGLLCAAGPCGVLWCDDFGHDVAADLPSEPLVLVVEQYALHALVGRMQWIACGGFCEWGAACIKQDDEYVLGVFDHLWVDGQAVCRRRVLDGDEYRVTPVFVHDCQVGALFHKQLDCILLDGCHGDKQCRVVFCGSDVNKIRQWSLPFFY